MPSAQPQHLATSCPFSPASLLAPATKLCAASRALDWAVPFTPPHQRARNTEQPTGSRASCRTFAGQLNKHLLFIHQRQIKSFLGDWNCLFRSCTLGPSPPTLLREPFPLYLVLWGQHGAVLHGDRETWPPPPPSTAERNGKGGAEEKMGMGWENAPLESQGSGEEGSGAVQASSELDQALRSREPGVVAPGC